MEEGRTEEDMNQQQQQQRRRLKLPIQSENQPQQPQKCPRCESLNTKFCYYNNYSLSQPRYFCKTCRRYWTQGGTLRNVPVGGGCRRGRRAKPSSSGGENSRSQPSPPPPPPPPQQLQVPQNLTNKEYGNFGLPANSYYSGGGFLSSLAAMQSLSRPQGGFNQPFNVAGGQFGGGSSNLGVAQGFNLPSFRSQESHPQQIQHQSEIYQMGNRDKNIEPLYQPDHTLVQPNRPLGSWTHSFINNNINGPPSSPSFWMNSGTSGSSMNPNQWPDLSPP